MPSVFYQRRSPFDRPLQRVHGIGPQPCRAMLVGERPGREEATHRPPTPFVGWSGQYLDTFLAAANIDRQSLYITNLVKEFTEYSKPVAWEIARDHDDLVGEILSCDPEIICLVGGYAVEHILMNGRAEMEKVHGVPFHVDSLFGGELTRDGGWVVMPIIHPAVCIHAPESMPSVLDDILSLGKYLDGEITVRDRDPYAGREDYRTLKGEEVWDILRDL